MSRKIIVIGSGFAGLSAATHLAAKGHQVKILEKNDRPGGRARSFFCDGYTFDMGPSWYWMPDVFEHYFRSFGKEVSDYYQLQRLDPSYQVFFGKADVKPVPAGLENIYGLFESIEPGAGKKLQEVMRDSAYKYQVGMQDLVYKPGRSLLEFADLRVVRGVLYLDLLKSIRSYVHKNFKNPQLRQIMEFPILFLGGTPADTPALYSLMNYADMALGTWYPMGGMHKIVEAMVSLATEMGVEIACNEEVERIEVIDHAATAVHTSSGRHNADVIIAGADYHHVEQELLPEKYRRYSQKYWQSRKMAPSSLLFYLGVNKPLKNLLHHNLFFDEDFDAHAKEIYTSPKWPHKPLFYVSVTSKTDDSVAPEGCENVFLLMPVAPGLEDGEEIRDRYYEIMMERIEKFTEQDVRSHVVYKRSYAQSDFISDYHAFKGNAYGLANTLNQTSLLKPSLRSSKISNLYYTGQLTVPGPGVPPALISGEVVAHEVVKDAKN